jgi:CBS domain containing-hemolysin-like protein
MIPIAAVVTVRLETTIEQLLEIFRRSGFDRYPMVNEAGKIIGVVTVFDLIVDRPAVSTAGEYLRRILTVRPDEQAALVLRRLRASPINLAAVVDESGNTVGIVSVEDLVNPLVKVPSEAAPQTCEM